MAGPPRNRRVKPAVLVLMAALAVTGAWIVKLGPRLPVGPPRIYKQRVADAPPGHKAVKDPRAPEDRPRLSLRAPDASPNPGLGSKSPNEQRGSPEDEGIFDLARVAPAAERESMKPQPPRVEPPDEVEPPPGRIDLVVVPGTLEVCPGEQKLPALEVRRDGVTGPVALSFLDVPEGVAIDAAKVPADEGRVEVPVRVGKGVKPGEWTIRVEAEATAARCDGRFLLRVTAPGVIHLSRGEGLIMNGDPALAITEFEAAFNDDANRAKALAGRAWAFLELGDPSRAIADCDRALELDPVLVAAYVRRSCARRTSFSWDQALEDASTAIDLDPGCAEAYLHRGHVRQLKGDPQSATADLQRASSLLSQMIGRDGASSRAHYLQGLIDLVRKDGEKDGERAIQDFTKAIDLAPGCALAYHGRGLAYRARAGGRNRDYELALEDFRKAIELAPRSARAYLDRGICYLSHRALAKALDDLNRAVNLSPEFALAHFYRGIDHELMGHSDEALDDFDEAIRQAPSFADAYLNRAAIRRKQKRLDDALDDYSKVIALKPRGAEGYFRRGSVLLDLGESAKAVDDFTRAVELETPNALAYFSRGSAYRNLGRYDDALADYKRALEQGLSGSFATQAIQFCAWRYYMKGMYDQALDHIGRVIGRAEDLKRPDLVEAYELRGQIFVARKDYQRAYSDFDQAIKLDPRSKAKRLKEDAIQRELEAGPPR
jgi:tetratricopeptide (TPR) repeat protein